MSSLKCVLLLAIYFLGSVVSSPILPEFLNKSSINLDVDQQLSNSNLLPDSNSINNLRLGIRAKQSKLMQSFMNTSIDPCDNFYDYACGNWEKHNPIPKDKWRYSTTQLLQSNLQLQLKELLSEPIDEDERPLSAINKAKLYYKNCLDQETTNQKGVESLLKLIEGIGGWPVLETNWTDKEFDWVQLSIDTAFVGNGIMIAFDVVKNPTVPTENTMFLKQTTLGMVNRDNYMKKENSKSLEAYRKFVKKVLQLLNVNDEKAQEASDDIVNFEVLLANATLPMEATKTLNFYQLNITQLSKSFSYIDWQKYLSGVQGTKATMNQTIVMQLGIKYFENLYYLLTKTKTTTLANYMIWRLVLFEIINLGESFRAALDEFTSSITGQAEPAPLWKICVNQVNAGMGMATSGMYIKKYFDEFSKNETLRLINSLKEIFNDNLVELDWIDSQTKAYAKDKANAMRVAAGYPDYIRSEESLNKLYKEVEIVSGKHFENSLSMTKHNWRKSRDRLFKPYDRDQWTLPPTIVNALYNFGANRILILASILQPPIFHRDHPQSLNYGAIGMFMGHEIIHGFDDIGRNFDSEGNTFEWWSPKAIVHFKEKQKCFLKQYENFSKEDQSFKSIATISENLADNGGLRLAYKAYSKIKQQMDPSTLKDETFPDMTFNEDQLFFLSFAQTFCAATRPEALIESKSYEAHSPEKYRILGALMNFEKFSETFQCPVGSRFNPSEKCRLW
ncbi:neprilysin-4-like [Episyrphus balteatus]|uniref:neprilysin-4-like n=1 Tax=Episyrphus balteatus TaxID=286459 RepID=UPI00248591A1|nr:neprilysin-4-like [Episyrphus balteatus]